MGIQVILLHIAQCLAIYLGQALSHVIAVRGKCVSYHSSSLTKCTLLQTPPLSGAHLHACSPQTEPSSLLFLLKCICEPSLHVCGGVGGGEVLHAHSGQFLSGRWPQEELAGEDLAAGLAEILREESVKDGVDAGVPVGQAVRDDAEGEGDVVQGKVPKLCPHGDDVVWQPGEQEHSNHEEHRLRRLEKRRSWIKGSQ